MNNTILLCKSCSSHTSFTATSRHLEAICFMCHQPSVCYVVVSSPEKDPPSSHEIYRLFVYGTLKAGFPLHSWIASGKCMGTDSIIGELYDLGSYPIIFLHGSNLEDIEGELWDIDKKTFDIVARMEMNAGFSPAVVETKKGRRAFVFHHTDTEWKNHANRIKVFDRKDLMVEN